MSAHAPALAELRNLVSQLERSGLAERRADIAQLLDRSRAMLGEVSEPPRRARRIRMRARPAAKLGGVLRLLFDVVLAGAALAAALALALAEAPPVEAPFALAAALGWGLWRWGGLGALLGEAGFRLRYALRWGWLWLAEAFSDGAFDRLQILLDARDVMRGWRAARRALRRPATLEDVAAWLAEAYGPAAAARLRAALPPARTKPRWSLLIALFERLAASDALWPEQAVPMPASAPSAPPPVAVVVEPPELVQRRADLREAIKKKRAEIARTHEWKMKTPAEVAERDRVVAELRQQVAALEAELRALG